jgi:myo-inositol 2-dehydrogenase/D-chiro-inositol 1-dehydrogenase/scyllo-inositol 2-dehydrogenase (NAD+)
VSDALNVLLVGAGRAGLVHGRSFASGIPGARLAAIADPSADARERAARELGCDLLFDNPLEAVTDRRIAAVVVAGPTFTHAHIAVAALEAGIHVLCEKPLASDLDEAKAIAEAEASSTGSLSMAFMRRFDRGFKRTAERIAAGDIGRPVLVRSSGRGPGLPPEWAWDVARSGGLIAEVNSHDLDTVRWMSGQEFDSVHALGRAAKRPDIADRYPGFVDVVIASFELDGGALAQIDGACPADYGYDARVEVFGTEGTILVGGPVRDSALLVRKEGASADPVDSWRDLFADAYRAEDAHFVAVAREEAIPVAGLEDGVRALEGVVAVNRSLAERRPISIEEVATR